MTKNTRRSLLLFTLALTGLGAVVTTLRTPTDEAVAAVPTTHAPAAPSSSTRGTSRTSALLDPERTTRADVVALSPESAADELERLERDLEDEHAIERLNEEDLDPATRARFGARLHTLTLLREHVLHAELAKLTERIEAYEETHEERVARALRGEDTPP